METTLIKTQNAAVTSVPTTILKFRKAGMNDMATLLHFISEYPSRSCDFSVGGILLWTDYFNYELCVIADTLFLKGEDERGVFFHQPLGKMSEEKALRLIRDYCEAYD
ncbi:MAG: hypothetical protein K2H96_02815, partial [Muribaculaceae bacterium]|nr:hypothetical protein [Muribaculaceae bacterium]